MTRILVTGAAGAVGQSFLAKTGPNTRANTGKDIGNGLNVVATDIQEPLLLNGARFRRMDVTGDDPSRVITDEKPDVVVHLASIVSPPKGSTRDLEYKVDVTGTQNVLDACITNKVRRIVVTSSGAAYGYHADNPVPLREHDAIRGNEEFAYSHHKRLVEEMLIKARGKHPDLEQVILRVGTVLGAGLENQITTLFHQKRLLALLGYDSPFVFIWTQDLANILLRASTDGPQGIFNCAGDGAMDIRQLASAMNKSCIVLPAWLLKLVLAIAKPLGLSRYGPEQVRFLQYRPVLDNAALKSEFGYVPELTSAEVFGLWQKAV